MECPRCRWVHPDEAAACVRCGEALRARRSPGAGPFVAFGSVGTLIEGWSIAGPLVINEAGLVFFVREMRITKANFAQAGVRTGGLIGLALGALIDSARGRYDRPEKITLRPAAEVMHDVRGAMADAPDIASCREFFTIERPDIRRISRASLGGLKIEARALSFRISAIDRIERASGFLKLKRYPFDDG